MLILDFMKSDSSYFFFFFIFDCIEDQMKIPYTLTDKSERTIVESSGGGGGDDGDNLHLREGRVALIGSHHMRIEQSRLP